MVVDLSQAEACQSDLSILTVGFERRRPDLLIEATEGTHYGVNVGRTRADGTPVTRDTLAIEDLEDVGVPMHFVPYDR